MHVPPTSVSALPHILSRSGSLFATHALDRAPIAPRQIIVAAPDHHLILEAGHMRSTRGPRVNNHRPSIDVLFRSAAIAYGANACGVLLSGTLDDGVAGLVAIRAAGGKTLVQDPADAEFPDLPANALEIAAVDGSYSAAEMSAAITAWVEQPRDDARSQRFRELHSVPATHQTKLEEALRAALRALEERRDLLKRLWERSQKAGDGVTARRLRGKSAETEADLERIYAGLETFLDAASRS